MALGSTSPCMALAVQGLRALSRWAHHQPRRWLPPCSPPAISPLPRPLTSPLLRLHQRGVGGVALLAAGTEANHMS